MRQLERTGRAHAPQLLGAAAGLNPGVVVTPRFEVVHLGTATWRALLPAMAAATHTAADGVRCHPFCAHRERDRGARRLKALAVGDMVGQSTRLDLGVVLPAYDALFVRLRREGGGGAAVEERDSEGEHDSKARRSFPHIQTPTSIHSERETLSHTYTHIHTRATAAAAASAPR
jgi:hypothetical protein